MIRGMPCRAASSSFSTTFSVTRRRCSIARDTSRRRCSGSTGLAREVERAFLHRSDGILNAAVGRHDDDRRVDILFLHRPQHAEAVTLRQAQVGQHDGRPRLGQLPPRLRFVTRFNHGMPVALERVAQHRAQRIFVFDDQDLCGGNGHGVAGGLTRPFRQTARRAATATSRVARRRGELLPRCRRWPGSARRSPAGPAPSRPSRRDAARQFPRAGTGRRAP